MNKLHILEFLLKYYLFTQNVEECGGRVFGKNVKPF